MSVMTDIFIDSARSQMDLAGVLEVDDETAYPYLCSIDENGGQKVIDALSLGNDVCDKSESDFQILWNDNENILVVVVGGEIRGGFQLDGVGSNLTFQKMTRPQISANVKRLFHELR